MADILAATNVIQFQIGKLLHEWQRIESNLFQIYVSREGELSNHRLLATTFHHIRSFDTKLSLTDKILSDHLTVDPKLKPLYDKWEKNLRKPLSTEYQVRNNIVHGEINFDRNNIPVIAPFATDTRRYEGHTPAFWYDMAYLTQTHTRWFNLVSTMIDFEKEVDPSPWAQAMRQGRLAQVAEPPEGRPSPTENK